MYDLWNNNGKCPPTLMAEATWVTAFALKSAQFTPQGKFRMEFLSRPGLSYTIEFKDSLTSGDWQTFAANGTFTATNTAEQLRGRLHREQLRAGLAHRPALLPLPIRRAVASARANSGGAVRCRNYAAATHG